MRPLDQFLPTRDQVRQFAQSRRTHKWGIGIVVFVAVFGLANIYVKALNKVKQR